MDSVLYSPWYIVELVAAKWRADVVQTRHRDRRTIAICLHGLEDLPVVVLPLGVAGNAVG